MTQTKQPPANPARFSLSVSSRPIGSPIAAIKNDNAAIVLSEELTVERVLAIARIDLHFAVDYALQVAVQPV